LLCSWIPLRCIQATQGEGRIKPSGPKLGNLENVGPVLTGQGAHKFALARIPQMNADWFFTEKNAGFDE
jgi:hypothetical protein